MWLDSLNQLPPASLHSLGDNLPGKGLTVLGPVQTPKRITIEVGLFYKWASYLLVSKYSLQMEILTDGIFLPVVKIYISAKNFG